MRVHRNRFRWPIACGLLLLASLAGCATGAAPSTDPEAEEAFGFPIARFTNLSDPACRRSFSAQVTSILVKEGETADAATAIAARVFEALWYQTEPGPFYALSSAGPRYAFVLRTTEFGCVLRLYQSHRKLRGLPVFSYTNTSDYIANRTLLYCSCSDTVDPDED
jgi:hypothetical protein